MILEIDLFVKLRSYVEGLVYCNAAPCYLQRNVICHIHMDVVRMEY